MTAYMVDKGDTYMFVTTYIALPVLSGVSRSYEVDINVNNILYTTSLDQSGHKYTRVYLVSDKYIDIVESQETFRSMCRDAVRQ